MRWREYINEDEVRKTIRLLKPEGEPFECRIISGDSKRPISGYFRDAETLLQKLDTVNINSANIYITLNRIDDACMSRMQREKFLQSKVSTSDNDVTAYEWLFIDLDPNR